MNNGPVNGHDHLVKTFELMLMTLASRSARILVKSNRADAPDAGVSRLANNFPAQLANNFPADAHDAGRSGAIWRKTIELMLMMLACFARIDEQWSS